VFTEWSTQSNQWDSPPFPLSKSASRCYVTFEERDGDLDNGSISNVDTTHARASRRLAILMQQVGQFPPPAANLPVITGPAATVSTQIQAQLPPPPAIQQPLVPQQPPIAPSIAPLPSTPQTPQVTLQHPKFHQPAAPAHLLPLPINSQNSTGGHSGSAHDGQDVQPDQESSEDEDDPSRLRRLEQKSRRQGWKIQRQSGTIQRLRRENTHLKQGNWQWQKFVIGEPVPDIGCASSDDEDMGEDVMEDLVMDED